MAIAEQDDNPVDKISHFLQQPNIAVTRCPLTWWRDRCHDYPRIRDVTRRYLAVASTSVASERLFSGAGEPHARIKIELKCCCS